MLKLGTDPLAGRAVAVLLEEWAAPSGNAEVDAVLILLTFWPTCDRLAVKLCILHE